MRKGNSVPQVSLYISIMNGRRLSRSVPILPFEEMHGTIAAALYMDDKGKEAEAKEDDDVSSSSEDNGLTENQSRLLYLIDLHTSKTNDGSRWIRKQALSVLLYDGIVNNIFDYDYSPQSTMVENRRVWINVSQEGHSGKVVRCPYPTRTRSLRSLGLFCSVLRRVDIELLREEELVNALLVSSKSYRPVVLYQVSDKGQELLRTLARREKEIVNAFAHKPESRELLRTSWDGDAYWLESASGYKRRSSVTEVEDVSYVSSAYIPQCLRYGGRPTLSNAHRAHESGETAAGGGNIRDGNLDEIITLNSVSVIVAEYIPFGA